MYYKKWFVSDAWRLLKVEFLTVLSILSIEKILILNNASRRTIQNMFVGGCKNSTTIKFSNLKIVKHNFLILMSWRIK